MDTLLQRHIKPCSKPRPYLAVLRKSLLAAYGSNEYRDVSPHMVGRKIALIPGFVAAFPLDGFFVEAERTRLTEEDDEWGHYKHEAQQIAEYRAIYGESPPLNG